MIGNNFWDVMVLIARKNETRLIKFQRYERIHFFTVNSPVALLFPCPFTSKNHKLCLINVRIEIVYKAGVDNKCTELWFLFFKERINLLNHEERDTSWLSTRLISFNNLFVSKQEKKVHCEGVKDMFNTCWLQNLSLQRQKREKERKKHASLLDC